MRGRRRGLGLVLAARHTDLAGIRDAAAVAKLRSDERAVWEKLWADVAALLKKAEDEK